MKVDTCYLILDMDRSVNESASRLRGYIGNMFKEYTLVHNHK